MLKPNKYMTSKQCDGSENNKMFEEQHFLKKLSNYQDSETGETGDETGSNEKGLKGEKVSF